MTNFLISIGIGIARFEPLDVNVYFLIGLKGQAGQGGVPSGSAHGSEDMK